MLGFVIGSAAGTVLGAASGAVTLVRRILDPTVQALRAIPSIAWVPLFILWFGIFETSKVTLIAVGVFFPVYLGVMAAIGSVDRKLIEVGRIFRLSPLALTRRVLLPAILPAWVVALRTGLGLGFMFVVAAEIMGASEGLGYLLVDGQQLGKPDEILVALITFAIVGQCCDSLLVLATGRLIGWQGHRSTSVLTSLSFRALGKIYADGTVALADVTLTIEAGEIVVLLGASGCGKTSLLRIAAGLEDASSGAVCLDGTPITGPHPAIGMVFQEPRLMPWLTAVQNVAFGLSAAQIAEAGAILERVGLSAQGGKWPRDLSGGQQQRVALARALVAKPKVLLLEEPFSALDAMTREDLQDHLLELWAVDRPTIVLVTHDIEEAAVLADRIAILTPHPGRLKAVVTPPTARPRRRDDGASLALRHDLRALLGVPQARVADVPVKSGRVT